jgi:hypothetical protein
LNRQLVLVFLACLAFWFATHALVLLVAMLLAAVALVLAD